VFASNDFGNCGNQENQKIIYSGSANLFAGGAGFENQLYFYCYGLKISDHIRPKAHFYLGLQQLQFEVEDGNECAANSHNCDLSAHCFITMGSLQCFCKAGYTGDGTTGNCADVNECDLSTHNCDLNADCSNSVGSFACSCRAGYTGDGTTGNCADINECNSGPCKNGGTCANSDGSYSCRCRRGWMGKNCNWDLNECNLAVDICWNGGTCTNSQGSFSCKCTKFWEGSNCQKKKTKIQCPQKYSKYDCNESVGRRYGCHSNLKCWRSDGNSWCYSKGSGHKGYDWCNVGNHAGCKAAAERPCRS